MKVNAEKTQVTLVKIWSDSVNNQNIKKLMSDVEKLENETKNRVVLITSWAVSEWSNVMPKNTLRSVCALVWQPILMQKYQQYSSKPVGQVLIDDYINEEYLYAYASDLDIPLDLQNKFNYYARKTLQNAHHDKDLTFIQGVNDALESWVMPILNHNDGQSSIELERISKKTDNDQNLCYTAEVAYRYRDQLSFEINNIVNLTDTNWIYDGNKKTLPWEEIDLEKFDYYIKKYWKYIHKKISLQSTWNMDSKFICVMQCLMYGIREAYISNAKNWLQCLGQETWNFTRFTRSEGVKTSEPA